MNLIQNDNQNVDESINSPKLELQTNYVCIISVSFYEVLHMRSKRM